MNLLLILIDKWVCMNVLIKKKCVFYIFGIIGIMIVSLLGGLGIVSDKEYSVISAILNLPSEQLKMWGIREAFNSCLSGWLYVLMPIVVSVPTVSYIYDEIKSKFYINVIGREGRYRYLYSRVAYSALSSAVISLVGFALYTSIICMFFDVNRSVEVIGESRITVLQLIVFIFLRILFMVYYGIAMSLFASFMVFLYPNLFFDLSVLFIVSYVSRDVFISGNFIIPTVIITLLLMLYIIMWKFRSERI